MNTILLIHIHVLNNKIQSLINSLSFSYNLIQTFADITNKSIRLLGII